MPYRPRELAVRAREAATLLLNTLDHDEMVQRFLDIYAAENRRPGRADQPAHYREQLETIRREALLAMVLRTEAALPTRLKVHVTVRETKRRVKPKKGKKSGKRKRETRKRTSKPGLDLAIPLLDLFREEFFVALGQALRWSNEDAQEFWHDLELYENLTVHEARHRQGRSGRVITSGPFVDRTALLLDPSLMEQARRAAGKFQMELNAAADRVLRRTFLRRRAN
jgi:hypothetical protein